MSDNCEECQRAPFDCTCCSRMCEPYDWDEESLCEYINNHIKDLHVGDCGAFQVRDEKIGKVVDIEWNDGVSGFVLKDVLDYIKENGTVKRSELMEFTC